MFILSAVAAKVYWGSSHTCVHRAGVTLGKISARSQGGGAVARRSFKHEPSWAQDTLEVQAAGAAVDSGSRAQTDSGYHTMHGLRQV